MENITLKTKYQKMLADTLTPVSVYLRLRDRFAASILLESSDYNGRENHYSYICCQPDYSFIATDGLIEIERLGESSKKKLTSTNLVTALNDFTQSFKTESFDFKFQYNGLFGYTAYDAVRHFESLELKSRDETIPAMIYRHYRFIIVFDHFKNEMFLFEHYPPDQESQLQDILVMVQQNSNPVYPFKSLAEETSSQTDEAYIAMVKKGIDHCKRGDVFQVVLSRRFRQNFRGDEFNVYRSLRSINPSPYLFFFDYGNFKLFGSSPEAQIQISHGQASIYPIAGTFKRSGNEEKDKEVAQALLADPKENAEHMMLVDLARNDLSKSSSKVEVTVLKELQRFSHVIHMTSRVDSELVPDVFPLMVAADTFPAGTLSGAPKYRAMELIDEYEPESRNYYGGAIGMIGFDGSYNHAIMIRSFLSKNQSLHYQAGAGVVAHSDPENELQEVKNKLNALRSALQMAQTI